MINYKIKVDIYNYLIPFYLTIFYYESVLHYFFNINFSLSILKIVSLVYIIMLIFFLRIKLLRVNLMELSFFIAIVLLFIFSYNNLAAGLSYSISMLFLFVLIYLLKHIREYLNFEIIIKYTLILNLPLLFFNLLLSFDMSYFTYKHQFFGTFGNPNVFGMWILFINILIYLYKGNDKIRISLFMFSLYLTILSISRSTIIASLFITVLFFWNHKKIIFMILSLFGLSVLLFMDEIQFISYILDRFSGDSARDFENMFRLIINNNFLPNGTNTFSEIMFSSGSIPDNSYLALVSDIGFLSIFYFLPFLYVLFASDLRTKLLILPLLFQSIFEKALMSTTNSYLFLLLLMIIVFPEQLKIYKMKFNNKKGVNVEN